MGRSAILLTTLISLLAAGCKPQPEGRLALYWSINGEDSAAACAAAGVTTIRILTDHSDTVVDDDPLNPSWAYVDAPCADLSTELPLAEGIYRVRLVALGSGPTTRSQVVGLLGVQVVHGHTTNLPQNPALEPPIDLEVSICGDGLLQTGEWCDASNLDDKGCADVGYDDGQLACNADCSFDLSRCNRCGDQLAAGEESCDGTDLGGLDCAALGLDGTALACNTDCSLDLASCTGCGNGVVETLEDCDDANQQGGDGCSATCELEQGALSLDWTVLASDASTLSSCAAEGIVNVDVAVRVAGAGIAVHDERVSCATGGLVIPELGFGLLTVTLTGRDAGDATAAQASSGILDHSHTAGSAATLELIAGP